MKYKREKCDLCCSKRKLEKIEKILSYNICTSCISSNRELKSYLKEYNKIKNIKTENTNESDKKISLIIENFIKEENQKISLKNNILNKVSNKENKSTVMKTLNSFSFLELQDCENCLNEAKNDLDKLKDNTFITKRRGNLDLPDPLNIIKDLKESIIDQEYALEDVTFALIQHLARIRNPNIPKNNILLLGPTGTGKTEISRVLSNYLNIPLVILDATSFTSEGYVGASLSDTVVNSLLMSSNGNKKIAENSIVFIDEIDKKAVSKYNESGINTLSIQQELLKMLEGTDIKGEISSEDGKHGKKVSINTSNILFICAGAFDGLEDIIKKRMGTNSIGLNSNKQEFNDNLDFTMTETSDLKNYGLTTEFLGRFSTITATKKLTSDSLFKIIKNKKNSICNQYQKLFEQYEVNVIFSDEFIKSIISLAEEQGVGARGINKIFIKKLKLILLNIYKFVQKDIIVNEDNIDVIERKKIEQP